MGGDARSDAGLDERFGLLATALAGRPTTVAAADGLPWTNGRTVFVGDADDARRQVIAQAALLRAGSVDTDRVRPLVGRPALARRYLVVEAARAVGALRDVLPAAAIPMLDVAVRSDSAEASLAIARSRVPLPEPPAWLGELRPVRLRREAEERVAGDVDVTKLDFEQLTRADADDDEEADDSASILQSLAGFVGDNPLARAMRKAFGTRPEGAANGGAGGAPIESVMAGRRLAQGGVAIGAAAALSERERPPEVPGVRTYPEWDVARGWYRPDWCTVVEAVPTADQLVPLERPARHDGLRRELAPLGLGMQRQRRQPGGHDLDLDAVVRAQVLRATGQTPPDSVYIDNLRRRRELAVLVLLDASGSANEREPGGSTLFVRQRDAAAALVDTLAILGDHVAAHAFYSLGRSSVVFTKVKDFDEPFGAHAMARLGGLEPGGYTRLGAAVRHGSHLLSERSGMHKLLVVISDGFPYDTGYQGGYAEGDARQALAEARSAGIGCLCLNLGSTTQDTVLDRVYGAAAHATARDIDALAPRMRRLVWMALESAERDRRSVRQAALATTRPGSRHSRGRERIA